MKTPTHASPTKRRTHPLFEEEAAFVTLEGQFFECSRPRVRSRAAFREERVMASNVEIVRGIYESFARGDLPGVLATFADDADVEFIGPSAIPFAGRYRGARGMGEAVGKFLETCDVLDFGPDEFHPDGDFVAVLGREHCRCKATGHEWRTPLVETFVVRDGKVRQFRCLFDTALVAKAYAGAPARADSGV
jgi:ketosteroid isomerase-like protein